MRLAVTALGLAAAAASGQDLAALLERPRVPLEARESPGRFSFASEAGQRVPGIYVKPERVTARLPVVVALHGTGGNKEGQLPLLRDLAAKGFLAVAIDGRYHGERSTAGKGSAEYVAAILRTWQTGRERPFLYDTVWDVLRLIDYLHTRPDVDPKRIGLIGFSKGGVEVYLAAAIDARIRAAVPCIGVQSFRWALDHDAWQSRVGTFRAAVDTAARESGAAVDAAFVRKFYARVAPGIDAEFDGPAMLPRIAPRPLLAINGDSDARTPLPGLMQCIDAAKAAYASAGAAGNFEFLLQKDTAHKVNPDSLRYAIGWLAANLAPGE